MLVKIYVGVYFEVVLIQLNRLETSNNVYDRDVYIFYNYTRGRASDLFSSAPRPLFTLQQDGNYWLIESSALFFQTMKKWKRVIDSDVCS